MILPPNIRYVCKVLSEDAGPVSLLCKPSADAVYRFASAEAFFRLAKQSGCFSSRGGVQSGSESPALMKYLELPIFASMERDLYDDDDDTTSMDDDFSHQRDWSEIVPFIPHSVQRIDFDLTVPKSLHLSEGHDHAFRANLVEYTIDLMSRIHAERVEGGPVSSFRFLGDWPEHATELIERVIRMNGLEYAQKDGVFMFEAGVKKVVGHFPSEHFDVLTNGQMWSWRI